MPRAVVITKLDQARADYDGVLRQAQDAFGDKVMPLYVPVRERRRGHLADRAARAQRARPTTALRGDLIEAVIEESEDETLMDRYLGGEEIAENVLVADLERAVARATFFPVVPVCSIDRRRLRRAARRSPSAASRPRPSTPPPTSSPRPGADGRPDHLRPGRPLVAEVVKTTSDPYVGRLSLVRVFSGTLRARRVRARLRPLHRRSSARTSATPTTTRTSGSARCRTRSASTRCPPAASSPATSARSAGYPRRDRRHAVRRRPPAGAAALVDARAAAAVADRRPHQGRRGQAVAGARPARRRGPVPAGREQRGDPPAGAVVHGRGARRRHPRAAARALLRPRRPAPFLVSLRETFAGTGARATAGTSSSPAGTASTPSATSRSSRSRRAAGSSSSTRSSAAPCRASSSPASRRACARRWSAACATATRSSTCGSPSPTARRTASTPPTWPSRCAGGAGAARGRRGRRR